MGGGGGYGYFLESHIMKKNENDIFKSTGSLNFHGLLQMNLEEKCTAFIAEKMKLLLIKAVPSLPVVVQREITDETHW